MRYFSEPDPYCEVKYTDYRGRCYGRRFRFTEGHYGEARKEAREHAEQIIMEGKGKQFSNIVIFRVTKLEVPLEV